jgi:hypothetical protein
LLHTPLALGSPATEQKARPIGSARSGQNCTDR